MVSKGNREVGMDKLSVGVKRYKLLCIQYVSNKNILCGLSRWLSGKKLTAMQEKWVGSSGEDYPLEKEMATHSNILA